MSLVLSLIPLAVAMNVSMAASVGAAIGVLSADNRGNCGDLPPVETIFNDPGILLKTLGEHGMQVQTVAEQEYRIETEAGVLHYFRASESSPFMMEVTGVKNLQELLDSMDSLENEYGRNVQKFTYDKVMCNLRAHGLSLEQEDILEDDSILLTLNVGF